MADKKESVTVRFVKSPTYQIIPVNGVWGVETASGDILCNFALDSWTIPSEIDYKPNKLQEANEIERRFDGGNSNVVIRELQAGIVMNRQTAEFLVSWLRRFLDDSDVKKQNKDDAE